jgi:hypothetical protein
MIPSKANALSPPDPYVFTNPILVGGINYGPRYYTSGRTLVTPTLVPGQHTTVLISWGDSLIASTDNSAYTVVNTPNIQDYNINDGGCYLATTPALGCTNENNPPNNGFWIHRLADSLITNSKTQRVILVNMGIGSTTSTLWAMPIFTQRFIVAFNRLTAAGFLNANKVFIIDSLGANDQVAGTSQSTMNTNLNTIISAIRSAGFTSTPCYLALSSFANGSTGGSVGAGIISAIQSSIASNTNCFTGANTDAISVNSRYDQTHYTASGSAQAASLWYNILSPLFP